ncbi:MAG: protein kinase [Myxococcaceae bacterium]|nr:protein kinase [Myxococcaceae bacterium]
MKGCATEAELLQFTRGELPATEAARIGAHVDGCSDCRIIVSEVARSLGDGADDASAERPLVRGGALGRYLILEQVGQGGMGVVYSAYDSELDRRVAVKVLRQAGREKDRARLTQEARAMARLSHPNVAAVYGVESAGGRDFVVMEFIVGVTARRWLEAERSTAEVLDVFLQAGRGLEAAHQAGIVHRDFKPDNVMVRADGRVSVLDFGLARPTGTSVAASAAGAVTSPTSLTETGTVMGTRRYMPPEQQAGEATDARADQYAFCVSVHEALWGAAPGEAPTKGPKVGAELVRALEKGRSANAADRHPDLSALLEVLERARAPVRRPWLFGVAGLIVLVVAGFLYARPNAGLCAGGEAEVAEVWGAPLRAAVVQRLAVAKLDGAHVPEALDVYAARWALAHRQACEATRVRGEQSEDLLDRRMVCLAARRAALAATATLLASESGSPGQALQAVGNLPVIAECADARALLEVVPPPAGLKARAQLTQVQEALAKARATFELGRTDEAEPLTANVVKEARALGWAPALAEALLLSSYVLNVAGRTTECEDAAWQALAATLAARDARLEAAAWVSLAGTVANIMRRYAEGERLFAVAKSRLDLLPSEELLAARWYRAHGQALAHAGDLKAAIASTGEAARRFEALGLPSPAQLAHTYRVLCDHYTVAGQYPEGIAAARKAVAASESDPTGGSHLARSLSVLANVLRKAHQFDEARDVLMRAVTEAQKAGSRLSVAQAWGTLGELERDAGRLDAAARAFQMEVAQTEPWPMPNPYRGEALGLLGDVQIEQGETEEAERNLRKAAALFDASGLRDELDTLPARSALGRALIANGKQAEAKAVLAHVVSVLDGSTAAAPMLAPFRFMAAKALWGLAERRPKAKALATQARAALEGAERDDVDRWLGEHR